MNGISLIAPHEVTLFRNEGLAVASELRAIEVTDQESHDLAATTIRRRREWADRIRERFKAPKAGVWDAHKFLCKLEGELISIGAIDEKQTESNIIAWEREQKRLNDQKALNAAKGARAIEEQARKDAAEKAEAMGAPKEAVEQILAEPITTPPPSVGPAFQKAEGITTRENWVWRPETAISFETATEQQLHLTLEKIVKAAVKDKRLLEYLILNHKNLNSAAKRLKTAAGIPGIVMYDQGGLIRR